MKFAGRREIITDEKKKKKKWVRLFFPLSFFKSGDMMAGRRTIESSSNVDTHMTQVCFCVCASEQNSRNFFFFFFLLAIAV